MANRIAMIQGSSIDPKVIAHVRDGVCAGSGLLFLFALSWRSLQASM
jgi:hypothetical protein